jgi:hypothetical protein
MTLFGFDAESGELPPSRAVFLFTTERVTKRPLCRA